MQDKNKDKVKKEAAKRSLLQKIMSFGARDKAAKSPKEKFLRDKKKREFKRSF